MHHFARRTAGITAAAAATALLLTTGCGNDDDKDDNNAAATSTSVAMEHGEMGGTAGAAEETKIATQGGEFTVSGTIFDKYVQAGGPMGALGAPTGDVQNGPNNGKHQEFTGGAIYWSEDTGAHIVWGEIRKAWEDNGGASGDLGYPTSDEKDVAGGKESEFTGGTISWVDGRTTVTPKS